MKYTVILVLVLSIIGVFSFMKADRNYDLHRNPANTGVDVRVSVIFKKVEQIKDFETANLILGNLAKELEELETEEANALGQFFMTIKNTEGILYDLESVLEKFPLSSILIVNFLKSAQRVLPSNGNHFKVLIDRLFINKNNNQYSSIEAFQKDLIVKKKYFSDLLSLHESLVKVTDKYPVESKPVNLFKVDLTSYAGLFAKFIPEDQRVFVVNSALLHIAKAEIEKLIAHTYYLTAYNLDKYGELVSSSFKNTVKKVRGLSYKIGIADSNRVSAMIYHQKIQKEYYQKTFLLHNWAKESKNLEKSKEWALRSLSSTSDAIVASKQVAMNLENSAFSLDKKLVKVYSEKSQKAVEYEYKLISSNTIQIILDPLTGKSLKINPSEIFNSNKMGDLKKFFPVRHDQKKMKLDYGMKTINLNYGNPILWNDNTFAGLLPMNNQEAFNETARIVNRHPATRWVSSWLNLFL